MSGPRDACEPAASTGFTATVEGPHPSPRNGEVGLSARPAG